MPIPLLATVPYLATAGVTLIGAGAAQRAGERISSSITGGGPPETQPFPGTGAADSEPSGGLGIPWLAIAGFILVLVLGNTIVEGSVEELL